MMVSKYWNQNDIGLFSRLAKSSLGMRLVAMCPRTLYAASTSDRVCLGVLPTATDFVTTKSVTKRCVDISGRRYVCTLIERDQESSRLRARVSLHSDH